MTFADSNYDAPATPEPEIVAPEPPGYLWRPIEPTVPEAIPVEAAPAPKPPRLIPHLGHVFVFFILAIPAFIGGWMLTFFALLLLPHHANAKVLMARMTHEIPWLMAAQAVAYGLEWALAVIIFTVWWNRPFLEGIHWNVKPAMRWFFALAVLGIGTGVVISLAGHFVPMPRSAPILDDLSKSRAGAWMLTIFGVTVAPLTEELAFRGFLLPGLLNTFRWLQRLGAISEQAVRVVGIPLSILLTSIPFALLHSEQVSNSWGPLLLIGMVSVVLCIVRLRTDSVAAGVVVHAAYNSTLFAGLIIQTGGFHHLDKLKI